MTSLLQQEFRKLSARYGGSLAGAWAWLTGRRALEREGLE